MNVTIWKIPVDIIDEQTIKLPPCTEFLCARVQRNTNMLERPVLWVRVTDYEDERTFVNYRISIVCIRQIVNHTLSMQYLDTFTTSDGFTGHVFIKRL